MASPRVAESGIEPEEFEVAGVAGEPITLPITTGPATGYDWHLELPDGVARVDDTSGRALDPSTRLGDAGGAHLQIIAPSGDHVVVARLARPWAPDEPIRVVRIRVRVE